MSVEHIVKSSQGTVSVACPGDGSCKICHPYVPRRVGGYFHFFHRWLTVRDSGVYAYQVCRKCGMRRIERLSVAMMGPKDVGWLKTGKWTEPREAVDPFGIDDESKIFVSTAPRDQPMPEKIWVCRWNSEFCTGPKDCGDSEIPRKQRFCTAYVKEEK